MSGKTEWVKGLLAHKENVMMLETMLETTFHQGMPNDLFQSKYFDPNVPSLIVFDDLMRTVMNDDTSQRVQIIIT